MLALVLESDTTALPDAAADSVTVQVEEPGALIVAGEQLTELGCTVTVNPIVADWLLLPNVAVTVAFCAVLIVPVVAENVALLCPAPIVTLPGIVIAPVLPSDTRVADTAA